MISEKQIAALIDRATTLTAGIGSEIQKARPDMALIAQLGVELAACWATLMMAHAAEAAMEAEHAAKVAPLGLN